MPPVDDLQHVSWLLLADHAEIHEPVAAREGVSDALRARTRRAAQAAFIESDGRGYLARGHGVIVGVSNAARTIR